MKFFGIVLFICVVVAEDYDLSDNEYYKLPELFVVDLYDNCVAQDDTTFCYGTFGILPPEQPSRVYDISKKLSLNDVSFYNHTKIHRGLCLGLPSGCPFDPSNPAKSLEACVQKEISEKHNLTVQLDKFDYCVNKNTSRSFDFYDYMYLVYFLVVLGLNAVGTAADLYSKDRTKVNPWLLCFSMKYNWQRLTGSEADIKSSTLDKRYMSFRCFNGLKAILVTLVLLAHVALPAIVFPANPRFLEMITNAPEFTILANGTSCIQIFIVMSTFLRTFKTLIELSKDKQLPGWKIVVEGVADRIARISPTFITAVGLHATLFVYFGDGYLWKKYVEDERVDCRRTFWNQMLYFQNMDSPVCVPQAWYLAVDFQLYTLSMVILLFLIKLKLDVIKSLVNIFFGSLIVLFGIIYTWKLRPCLQSMNPESIRTLFQFDESFRYLYQSLWGSFPSAILGTMAAYAYYQMLENNIDLNKYKHFRTAFKMTVPAVGLYLVLGHFSRTMMSSRLVTSLYGTFDKPFFGVVTVVYLLGCLFKVDHPYRHFMEWRGWVPISRLSLTSLLFHTVVVKLNLCSKVYPETFSRNYLVVSWVYTAVLTLALSVPITLSIEYPFINVYKYYMKSKSNKTDSKIGEASKVKVPDSNGNGTVSNGNGAVNNNNRIVTNGYGTDGNGFIPKSKETFLNNNQEKMINFISENLIGNSMGVHDKNK